MLQVAYIRAHKEEVIERLAVKNFDAKEIIEELIVLDERRRNTQSDNDAILAESNKLSKEIGELFKMDEEIPASKLDRNVRAHGNLSEYVPIFLVLLMILEISGNASFNYLLLICSIFAYGRLAHAICFAFYVSNPFLRISGMLCTYLGLAIFAVRLLLDTLVN